jgi:hypothetical protein
MMEFKKPKEYVFLEGEPKSGISKKTNLPYEMNKITFADPATFENHKLDFKKELNLSFLTKGEKVFIETDFVAGWNGSDSRSLVVNVIPVLQVK